MREPPRSPPPTAARFPRSTAGKPGWCDSGQAARNPNGSVQRKRSHTMSSRLLLAALLCAVTVGVRAQQPAAAQTTSTTTLDDQAELAVTIYNSDIALVRDVRNIQI